MKKYYDNVHDKDYFEDYCAISESEFQMKSKKKKHEKDWNKSRVKVNAFHEVPF